MQLPNKTDRVFELLSKGKFLCENYPEADHRRLYKIVYDNYDNLYEYFSYIGYTLEREKGYFYFSKEETKQQLEMKLNSMLRFIDLVDFMLEYRNDFSIGYKVTPEEILFAVKENSMLKNKLNKIDKRDTTLHQKCKKILEEFTAKGVMAIVDEELQQYQVLNSFGYLQDFILSIQEVANE